MKSTLILASTAALFAFVSAVQATPTPTKGKTIHVHEIHRDQSGQATQNAPKVNQSADAAFSCRSHAEREMINPG